MHFNTKDLTGQRFGKLTVLSFDQTSIGKGRARWICTCDCDPSSRVSILSSHLKKGTTKSCGCIGNVKDLVGKNFGRLTVIKRHSANYTNRNAMWVCNCSCGVTGKIIRSQSLINKRTTSCGCFVKERFSVIATTHGFSNTPEYRSWLGAKSRCFYKKSTSYDRYGGSGITMYAKWVNDFPAFLNYMGRMPNDGQRYSIDRINNEKGYVPGNVRWATEKVQANNTSRNHYYEINGKQLSIAQIAEEYGIGPTTLVHRLKVLELPIEEAVKPVKLTLKSQYTFEGRTLTLGEWVEELDLHFPTVASRLFSGWKFKEAIEPIENKIINYDGETHSLQWWCELLSLDAGTTYLRVLRGENFEDIVKAA